MYGLTFKEINEAFFLDKNFVEKMAISSSAAEKQLVQVDLSLIGDEVTANLPARGYEVITSLDLHVVRKKDTKEIIALYYPFTLTVQVPTHPSQISRFGNGTGFGKNPTMFSQQLHPSNVHYSLEKRTTILYYKEHASVFKKVFDKCRPVKNGNVDGTNNDGPVTF